jgi:hypothetical protein
MKKLLYILPVLFLSVGCDNDDDDDTPSGSTKTQTLTQSSWKLETAGIDQNKDGTIDINLSAQINECVMDNTLKFEANGTGVVNEGLKVCANSPGQTTPFTWSFASNETALNITGNAVLGYGGQYKIGTLTDTKMSLSKDTTLPAPLGTQTLVANFIH